MKSMAIRDWRNVTIGVVLGLAVAFALGAAGEQDDSRYKLHVWSASSGQSSEHGAYRIDGRTGEVHAITGHSNSAALVHFEAPAKR